jgi:hypothetical protein
MTIKHVDPSGRETVVSVVSVGYDPEKRELIGYGPTERFTDGHAFVMNDAGKTVGAYNLRVRAKVSEDAAVTAR